MTKNVSAVSRILRSVPSTRVLIEVEVPEGKRAEFDRNYRIATGEMCQQGDYYRVIDNKWGVELRLYLEALPEVIRELESHCSVTVNTGIRSNEYSYRINDNELIRWLFREGYRLGPNNPQEL